MSAWSASTATIDVSVEPAQVFAHDDCSSIRRFG
jgi:hypothetical protein